MEGASIAACHDESLAREAGVKALPSLRLYRGDAPGSASDPAAPDHPAGAHLCDAPGSASDPAAPPAGDGTRRGKRKRFNGKKKDPTSVRGARMFIELGVPLICSECDAEETSRWAGGKADPNKPVCKICYERQVRRASHSLA